MIGILCFGALVLAGSVVAASRAAAAAPPILWQVPMGWQVPANIPAGGPAAGQLLNPSGIAVDPADGHVFVVDRGNARIDEFTAWGEFVKAFGWNVDASAPAEELQVCTVETGCKAGTQGGGKGQLGFALGIAIGSNHDLYMSDESNHRVEVFDEEGNFVTMFGGKVNRTKEEASAPIAEQNRCPIDPGDVCQAGVSGTGPGEFSVASAGSFVPGDNVASRPDGSVYVGDVGRIEKFDSAGNFTGEIKGQVEGKTVAALEVDATGNSYVAFKNTLAEPQSEIVKLGPAGEKLLSFPVAGPEQALALDGEGNLWAISNPPAFGTVRLEPRIAEFDAAGHKLLPTAEEEAAEKLEPPVEPFPFGQVFVEGEGEGLPLRGLAVSDACGQEDEVFASYSSYPRALLRAYGPAPDPAICPPSRRGPEIASTIALSVTSEGAEVAAQVNPFGQAGATFHIEYGTGACSEGGCPDMLPEQALGSAGSILVSTGSVALTGLQPNTTYHYRFVAKSDGGGPVVGPEETFTTWPPALPGRTSCPNQGFRTALSALLTDCRAYEMVSPADKEGADVVAVNSVNTEVPARLDQSAASGEALTYSAYRAFAGPKAAPFSSQYFSTRSPGGWIAESISPGRGEARESVVETGDTEYEAFSADLCQGWLRLGFTAEPQLDPRELTVFPNLFRQGNCPSGGTAYEALTTVPPPHLTETKRQFFNPQVQGFSTDGRCTVFRAPDTLTPEAPLRPEVEGEFILYESCGGTLRLVAILPDGTPSQSSSTAGIGNTKEALAQFQQRGAGVYRAVSEDGTKIYWTAPGTGVGKLYLRINADQPQSAIAAGECTEPQKACTLPVSGLVSGEGARFWTASPDGTRAFFSVGGSLYEYDATDPTDPKATLVAEGVADPLGMLGTGKDLSRIYFASKAAYSSGIAAGDPEPKPGEPNLYFLERGHSPRFIGILDPSDLANFGGTPLESKAISYEPGFRAARVSGDGLYATFMSSAPLTGFDNTDQRNGAADREVFLYEAGAEGGRGRLLCVSCDPSGARPLGQNVANNEATASVWAAARIPTWPSSLYASNALTAEGPGVRLFFDSFVPLVPRDVNGKADVYEWESATGKAGCEADGAERYVAQMAGCLSLISGGDSGQDSEFIDADPTGRNVFFATDESLLPQDPGLIDIYDAREGGGFPVAGSSQPCRGEDCQHAAPAPSLPSPSSGVIREGNPKKSCPKRKRKVKRKGGRTVCVAKKHHMHKKKQHRKLTKGKRGRAGHGRGTHR
jgi:hypothetical protein